MVILSNLNNLRQLEVLCRNLNTVQSILGELIRNTNILVQYKIGDLVRVALQDFGLVFYLLKGSDRVAKYLLEFGHIESHVQRSHFEPIISKEVDVVFLKVAQRLSYFIIVLDPGHFL